MSARSLKRIWSVIALAVLVASLVVMPGSGGLVHADGAGVGHPILPPPPDSSVTSTQPDSTGTTTSLMQESTLLLTGLSIMMF